MTPKDYFCAVCQKPFNSDEPHSTPEGGDCHEKCCPICHPYSKQNRPVDSASPRDTVDKATP